MWKHLDVEALEVEKPLGLRPTEVRDMYDNPNEIRKQAFSLARRGYDQAEVATFLAGLAADPQSSDPDQVRNAEFSVVRRGYDKAEVSTFLASIAAKLEASAADGDGSDTDDAAVAGLDGLNELAADLSAEVADVDEETEEAEVDALFEPEETEPEEAEPENAEPEGAELENAEPEETESADTETAIDWPSAPEHVLPRLEIPTLHQVTEQRPSLTDDAAGIAMDDGGFQQAATEISSLMREAHEGAQRLRAQADADVRAAVSSAQAELDEQRRAQAERLDTQSRQVGEELAAARAETDSYAIEMKNEADAYHAAKKNDADAYAESLRGAAETDAKAILAKAESYAGTTTEKADDFDRRIRADAEAFAERARQAAESAGQRIIDDAQAISLELRESAERDRLESEQLMNRAQQGAEELHQATLAETDRLLTDARADAVARSTEVLERSRAIVAGLVALERDSRLRLEETTNGIHVALAAATIADLPDTDLGDRLEELTEEVESFTSESDVPEVAELVPAGIGVDFPGESDAEADTLS